MGQIFHMLVSIEANGYHHWDGSCVDRPGLTPYERFLVVMGLPLGRPG